MTKPKDLDGIVSDADWKSGRFCIGEFYVWRGTWWWQIAEPELVPRDRDGHRRPLVLLHWANKRKRLAWIQILLYDSDLLRWWASTCCGVLKMKL